MSAPETHFVYVIRAADGSPLYVGHTHLLSSRISQHQHKPWFADSTSVTFERYDNEEDARVAESAAIAGLNPPHNIQGRTEPNDNAKWLARLRNRQAAHAAGEPCLNSNCRECNDRKREEQERTVLG